MSSELRVDKIVPVDGVPTGGGGGIVQVKQVIHSVYVEYNQNAYHAGTSSGGNFEITITPKFNTSKIVSMNAFVDLNAQSKKLLDILQKYWWRNC